MIAARSHFPSVFSAVHLWHPEGRRQRNQVPTKAVEATVGEAMWDRSDGTDECHDLRSNRSGWRKVGEILDYVTACGGLSREGKELTVI